MLWGPSAVFLLVRWRPATAQLAVGEKRRRKRRSDGDTRRRKRRPQDAGTHRAPSTFECVCECGRRWREQPAAIDKSTGRELSASPPQFSHLGFFQHVQPARLK